ncbi:hypothetical protein [Ammonifex degensii]|uniref:hypothetical protein n=1 Tax=Ammonifex degensii TaxID=42838 RepID=UPI0003184540|nr:hypothetical protein [Ammonifex degensii]
MSGETRESGLEIIILPNGEVIVPWAVPELEALLSPLGTEEDVSLIFGGKVYCG